MTASLKYIAEMQVKNRLPIVRNEIISRGTEKKISTIRKRPTRFYAIFIDLTVITRLGEGENDHHVWKFARKQYIIIMLDADNVSG